MGGCLIEGFLHDLHILDLKELADLGVDEVHHLFLLLFESLDEFILTLKAPVYRTFVELDKGYKLSMIGKRVREYGGGYTMIVDADDLISNRIAAYVKQHPGENGFGAEYGYVYNVGDSYVKRMYALDRVCGSCTIIRYDPQELPAALPDGPRDESSVESMIIRRPHSTLQRYMASIGRPVRRIPFPTTVYIRNTGDNHSMLNGGDLGWKRKIELMLRRPKPLSAIREEFGLKE